MGLINKEDAETLARIIGAGEAAKYLHAKSWRVHAMRDGCEVPLNAIKDMLEIALEGHEIFLYGPSGSVSIRSALRLELAIRLIILEEKRWA